MFLLVLALPDSPGQRAVKWLLLCVVYYCLFVCTVNTLWCRLFMPISFQFQGCLMLLVTSASYVAYMADKLSK